MNYVVASFGPFGTPEMLIMAVLVLVLFGAKKLPTFGRSLRRSMGEFRRAKAEFERELMRTMNPHMPERELPDLADLDSPKELPRRTFRLRGAWGGRNWIVGLLMLLCMALLAIALRRTAHS